jgi:transposase-like protein
MTKKKLNTYTPEFKESAIKLALDSDESIPQIAKNLGVNSNTILSLFFLLPVKPSLNLPEYRY